MILVTGGLGFIGSHLVKNLVEVRKEKVRILDDFSRGKKNRLGSLVDSVEIVQGDISDASTMQKAVEDCTLIFHLAAVSNVLGAVTNPDRCFHTNVTGTFELLKAAQAAKISRVVFSSSREVYGEPESLPVPETATLHAKNIYGASKIAGEALCVAFAQQGLPVAILRFANVFGDGDENRVVPIFLNRILKNEPFVLYGGNQVLDLVWIDTVVASLVQAGFGELPDGPTNIGSGTATKLKDMARWILDQAGSSSGINIEKAREAEVVGFVANIEKAQKWMGLSVTDPLPYLQKMVREARSQPIQTE